MTRLKLPRLSVVLAVLLPAVAVYACVDGPAAPRGFAGSSTLAIAPYLAVANQSGPTMAPEQANALADVFDRVDHFRMQVYRQSTGELVVDTVIAVTPGSDSYELSANVDATSNEVFLVVLTALEGDVPLFQSSAIPVVAAPAGAGTAAPTPTSIPLTYAGPGATATAVEMDPEQAVVSPGGTVQLGAKVVDSDGAVVADVPLSWTTAGATIATVTDGGVVSGAGQGVTQVMATTPTGLSASARVYVVGGSLAYILNGNVMLRDAAGGTATEISSGGSASGISWGADGSVLYSEGGEVTSNDTPLFAGAWPSMSPDGSKIAVDAGGQIWFANSDGSNPTAGPDGTTPVWVGARTLIVGGSSIEQVGVDGSGRTTLVPGDVGPPAVGPGGKIAYVDGGSLRVVGGGIIATGVSGRPSWSGDGMWLAVAGGGGILLAPADGSAPPVALPGLDGANGPAWEVGGGAGSPPALSLTGLNPDPPVPGQTVEILGSGFDDIIPKNNEVSWPTPDGAKATEVTKVTPSAITTVMPPNVIAGDILVKTYTGNATLAFVPKLGNLHIQARTPSGDAVPGLGVSLHGPDGAQAGTSTTDADGNLSFDGLLPGLYHLDLTEPAGFRLVGAAGRDVNLGAETKVVPVQLIPTVKSALTDPAVPSVGVHESVAVTVQAFDVNGNPVPSVQTASWGASTTSGVSAAGSGLTGSVSGVYPSATPGDAQYWVALDNVLFPFKATVTSYIEGTVGYGGGAGVAPRSGVAPAKSQAAVNIQVHLADGSGQTIATTTTDENGHYRFGGLFAGKYTVTVVPPEGSSASPGQSVIDLGAATPTGTADFSLTGGGIVMHRPPGVVAIYKDYNAWGTNREETILNSFGLVKGVDYVVRPTSDLVDGIPSGTSLIILTSLSGSGYPLANVNSPAAQANLDAWVKGGGWLLAHLADNVYGDGYMIPGLSGKVADGGLNCAGLVVTGGDHPFIRGPDGILGTSDDMNAANVARVGGCYDNHGNLAGLLPPGATVLLTEPPPSEAPVYATYSYGAGVVVVSTTTLEWGGSNPQIITNHLWWTVMGDTPATVVGYRGLSATAARAASPALTHATTSDVPVGGAPLTVPSRSRVRPARASGAVRPGGGG